MDSCCCDSGNSSFRFLRCLRRNVRLGITNFERTEILEGLEEGDEVILSDMSDYASRKEIHIR